MLEQFEQKRRTQNAKSQLGDYSQIKPTKSSEMIEQKKMLLSVITELAEQKMIRKNYEKLRNSGRKYGYCEC
jgi:hypothetical protein